MAARTLTAEQIIALWLKAGGTIATAPAALARALAESGGRTAVTSANPDGGTNVGIWQLDTRGVGAGHSITQLQDPLTNAKITVKATNGGYDWSSWSDDFAAFRAQAESAVASFGKKADAGSGGLLGLAERVLGDIGSGITGAAAATVGQLFSLPSQVTGFLSALEAPVQAIMWLVNPGNWARIIAGGFGFLLLTAGLITLGLAA